MTNNKYLRTQRKMCQGLGLCLHNSKRNLDFDLENGH